MCVYVCVKAMGYTVAAYPLTLLSASIKAMKVQQLTIARCRAHPVTLMDDQAMIDRSIDDTHSFLFFVVSVQDSLSLLKSGQRTDSLLLDFKEVQAVVGFDKYDDELSRYKF